MANEVILVDTSVLIDYYRKTNKENSVWLKLVKQGFTFSISVITKYEILSGASQGQIAFWENVLSEIIVTPLDESCIDTAIAVNLNLKRKRKQIDLADLLIAATAVRYGLTIATLNRKHFDRIEGLEIFE